MAKKVFTFGIALLLVAAACAPAPGEPERESLGRTRQALCAMPTNPPVPVANQVVPGRSNWVTSGTYDYGDGGCDGYVVKFLSLDADYLVWPHAALAAGTVPASRCSATRVAFWVWTKWNNGPWVYRGHDETTPDVDANGNCVGYVQKSYTNQPAVDWQVVIKAQVRTTSSATLPGGGTITATVNEPVSLVVLP